MARRTVTADPYVTLRALRERELAALEEVERVRALITAEVRRLVAGNPARGIPPRSFREIADALGLGSHNTVKAWVERGIE